MTRPPNLKSVLELLDIHSDSFRKVVAFARETGHPVPVDTRAWSQIVVSVLTGIKGLERAKGADLSDGSDVKGAITWEAIDTPRFNGVIKAGTKSFKSDRIESLDDMPYLFLVLWDTDPNTNSGRCRIWCVRPREDKLFREMCARWYALRSRGQTSNNFQLHPPRNLDSNVIRNTLGVFEYPLLFAARIGKEERYEIISYNPQVLTTGLVSIPG
jgi:hypothetical protein